MLLMCVWRCRHLREVLSKDGLDPQEQVELLHTSSSSSSFTTSATMGDSRQPPSIGGSKVDLCPDQITWVHGDDDNDDDGGGSGGGGGCGGGGGGGGEDDNVDEDDVILYSLRTKYLDIALFPIFVLFLSRILCLVKLDTFSFSVTGELDKK